MSIANLVSFKDARIEALQKKVIELQKEKQQLETFIFEVCDPECPQTYRHVVMSEVAKTQDEV